MLEYLTLKIKGNMTFSECHIALYFIIKYTC